MNITKKLLCLGVLLVLCLVPALTLLSALRRFAAGDSPYKTMFIDIIFIDNFRADCFLSPEIRFTPQNTRNDSRKARRQK